MIVSYSVAIAFDILMPVALVAWLRRRSGVGWCYLGAGALVFLVFQLLTRIPAMQLGQYLLADDLRSSQGLTWLWLSAAALSAGLFEEVGRYLGWRVLLRRKTRSFDGALMYGAGHGGLESALLVAGMAAMGLVNALVLPGMDAASLGLSGQHAEQLREAQRQIAEMPGWMPLIGAFERVPAMLIHLSCSLIVLQCFTRGSLRWLWAAIGYHALVDLVGAGGAKALTESFGQTGGMLLVEGLVAILGLTSLAIILRLRPDRTCSATPR
ncbi:MAG: YhfC family glutamic-type intramembrane protease [Polyangia bacterium]